MANRVVVKSGTFTLGIDTDGASSSYGSSSHQGSTSFQSKYGIAIPADKVPSPEYFYRKDRRLSWRPAHKRHHQSRN